MGLDVDFVVASESIKRLEKLLRDQEHGEREEICDDIVQMVNDLVLKYDTKNNE